MTTHSYSVWFLFLLVMRIITTENQVVRCLLVCKTFLWHSTFWKINKFSSSRARPQRYSDTNSQETFRIELAGFLNAVRRSLGRNPRFVSILEGDSPWLDEITVWAVARREIPSGEGHSCSMMDHRISTTGKQFPKCRKTCQNGLMFHYGHGDPFVVTRFKTFKWNERIFSCLTNVWMVPFLLRVSQWRNTHQPKRFCIYWWRIFPILNSIVSHLWVCEIDKEIIKGWRDALLSPVVILIH